MINQENNQEKSQENNQENVEPQYNIKQFVSLVAAGCIGGLVVLSLLPLLLPFMLPAAELEPPVPFLAQSPEYQQTAIIAAVQKVSPAVVGVTRYTRSPFSPEEELVQSAVGSGVIFRSEGYIVTNYHVIEGAEEIIITLSQGEEYTAEIIGLDPGTDLAVLRIQAGNDLPVAVFGDSDAVLVGEYVLAIGNPGGLQLQQSVSLGIISAKDRSLEVYDWVFGLLQTDAAVNPGNSGGPLVNIRGEVVGINSVKLLNAEGLGFSIPSNLVVEIIDSLLEHGRVVRPMLGVIIQEVTPSLARAYDLPVEQGLYVVEAPVDAPAYQAGIRPKDIIVAIADVPVGSLRELRLVLSRKQVGDEVEVTFIRNGESQTVKLVLADLAN